MLSVGVHSLLAVGLFLLINWLGKHSKSFGYKQLTILFEVDEAPAFNLLFRVLTPVVFIVIAAAAFYLAHLDFLAKRIFLVVAYYFAFRIGWNAVMGKARLLNWKNMTGQIFVSCALAYLAQVRLIDNKSYLFPDPATLGNELWLVIFGFVYAVINNLRSSPETSIARKNAYIKNRFWDYKAKFGQIVSSDIKAPPLEALVYAIMIFEAFNRPRVMRAVENLAFRFGRARTLGIMQVTTYTPISDSESVRLACKKIGDDALELQRDLAAKDFSKYRASPAYVDFIRDDELLNGVLSRYNGGNFYRTEVTNLYKYVKDSFYPESGSLFQTIGQGSSSTPLVSQTIAEQQSVQQKPEFRLET